MHKRLGDTEGVAGEGEVSWQRDYSSDGTLKIGINLKEDNRNEMIMKTKKDEGEESRI